MALIPELGPTWLQMFGIAMILSCAIVGAFQEDTVALWACAVGAWTGVVLVWLGGR